MPIVYSCLGCGCRFTIEATDQELAGRLSADRPEACPSCRRRIGTGPVRCRRCGAGFELAFPHWHVSCDVAMGDCPTCGTTYISACIC